MRSLSAYLLAALVLAAVVPARPAQGQQLFIEKSDVSPTEVDRIYVRGLRFLAAKQGPDGSWTDLPYGGEPAVVSLAVISMLAHGDDPNYGPYSQPIRRGLDFVLKQMNPQTGYIGRSMYNHGFSTLVLAESYGAVDEPRLGPALQKAVQLIVNVQTKNPFGAWRYSPESTDADTTVSGAQMVALFAARNAGIAVPESAIEKGLKFFQSVQTRDGGIGYTSASGPNGARTAIGCLVFCLAKDKNSKTFQDAWAYLQKSSSELNFHEYFLYYASQAYFQSSPAAWQTWNRNNIKSLGATQNAEGGWDGQFGTTFSTAASLLSLALNYRFLPIYER